MAGVLERMRRPQKQLVKPCDPLSAIPLRALKLQTAKEILAETFRISIPEVEEMIQNRFEETCSQESRQEDDGLWPREFRVEG
ncbi:Uncharacterised protein [uncultured archaeon]|nr:Uncharacterised protein [uncultured archaeon]